MLPKDEASSAYFPALTGLRAVAVFLVLIHHYNPVPPELYGGGLHRLAAETHIGVTVFFVLSGFLIGYRYLDSRALSLRTYFANRFARIYPMYFLLTTLTFGVLYYQNQDTEPFPLGEYLLNITFLRGLFAKYLYTGIAQGWSLTVEEMFYVSAPLAFGLIRRNGQWLWRLPLLLVALGVGAVLLCRGRPWLGLFDSFGFLFQFTYLGRAVEFFTGITLAWWLRRSTPGTAQPRFLTYAGVAGSLLCLWGLSRLHGSEISQYGVLTPAGMFINNVLLPLCGIGPLLWGLVREDTWLRRFLSSPPLLLLGKSSYVFYLIHVGVLYTLLREWLPSPVQAIVVLYGASILLYWAVEEPLNHWLRRVLRKPVMQVPLLSN